MKRQQPKPELGWAGASGEELGEQERQAEVQEGHGSHHQGVGSSLERQGGKTVSVPEDHIQRQVPPSCPGRDGKAEGSQAPLLKGQSRGISNLFRIVKTPLFSQAGPLLPSGSLKSGTALSPPPSTPLPLACHVAQAEGAWP